jgi:biotin carboxyl carrier protein
MPDRRTITAPLPGTFYRRPNPDADVYVSEGEDVRPGDLVGMIEVMKTFFEVRSEGAGTIARFLVENGDLVDAGQALVALSD